MRNEPCGWDIVIPYILYFILNFRMKRFRFCLVAGMLLFISVSAVAKGVPTSIQAAFEKMYPYVANAQLNPEKPDVPLNKNDAFQKVQKRRVQEKR